MLLVLRVYLNKNKLFYINIHKSIRVHMLITTNKIKFKQNLIIIEKPALSEKEETDGHVGCHLHSVADS